MKKIGIIFLLCLGIIVVLAGCEGKGRYWKKGAYIDEASQK